MCGELPDVPHTRCCCCPANCRGSPRRQDLIPLQSSTAEHQVVIAHLPVSNMCARYRHVRDDEKLSRHIWLGSTVLFPSSSMLVVLVVASFPKMYLLFFYMRVQDIPGVEALATPYVQAWCAGRGSDNHVDASDSSTPAVQHHSCKSGPWEICSHSSSGRRQG